MFRTTIPMMTAALLIAPAAFAQTAPAPTEPAPQTAAPSAAAPAAAAPTAAAPGSVTETEVTQFASAALAVDKIQKDSTVAAADKGTKMAEAVQMAGLDPNRFNQIGQAMQSDPALNKRIQDAAIAQQPAGGASTGGASAPK